MGSSNWLVVGFSKPKGTGIVAAAIRLVERTHYNHVFIKFRDPTTNLQMVLEAAHFQVRLISFDEWIKASEVVTAVPVHVEPEHLVRILTKAYVVLQRPYSILGLLGHLLMKVSRLPRNPYQDKGRSFICSELVAYLLDIPNPEEHTPKSVYQHLTTPQLTAEDILRP